MPDPSPAKVQVIMVLRALQKHLSLLYPTAFVFVVFTTVDIPPTTFSASERAPQVLSPENGHH
jgi:hypothetical protein